MNRYRNLTAAAFVAALLSGCFFQTCPSNRRAAAA
jgi:hypothetical protein